MGWSEQARRRSSGSCVVCCSVTVPAVLADEYSKEARTKQKWIIVGCT